MRIGAALLGDIKYQAKYGFYFLYAFISTVYVLVLLVCPPAYRTIAASVIILTDPAMLGAFFIGGIWLLEKGEGLHRFWLVSPLKPVEYVLAKAVSLAMVSTLAAAGIALAGLGARVDYALLCIGTFIGAMVFTLVGLLLASYARSVNHYMLVATLPLTVLLLPAILAAFGVSAPVLSLTPGVALWRVIGHAIGLAGGAGYGLLPVLLAWLGAGIALAVKRMPAAMQAETGGGNA